MDTEIIKGFIDSSGRVTGMPSRRKKRLYVLAYLAERIPKDEEFTEREFNDLLNSLHTFGDPASLRREMYDYFLINRAPDGSRYTVNKERLSIDELVEKYCT